VIFMRCNERKRREYSLCLCKYLKIKQIMSARSGLFSWTISCIMIVQVHLAPVFPKAFVY